MSRRLGPTVLAGGPGLQICAGALGLAILAGPIQGQSAPDDPRRPLPVRTEMGFSAAPVEALDDWGWTVEVDGDSARASRDGGPVLVLRAGTPFVDADGAPLQLADAPYRAMGRLFVPVQVWTELAGEAVRPVAESAADAGAVPPAEPAPAGEAGPTETAEAEAWVSDRRVVVIDAGHGGRDLGALGVGGLREKDVALGTALALADILRDSGYEVHMTRDDDLFIPVWERGPLANRLRAGAPGIFMSLHANSNPHASDAQGFETFFLAEARTEHERRLAALENTPPSSLASEPPDPETGDLSFLLDELRNRDTQRWSAHLAGLVQGEFSLFHPGPSRGVSQAPLAVITNALMPAVLVELGFVTNAEEAALLSSAMFQEDAARALARATAYFFQDYPPGRERDRSGTPE